jgi:hypothetical protein
MRENIVGKADPDPDLGGSKMTHKKNICIFFNCKIFQFLVIKVPEPDPELNRDPDPIRIGQKVLIRIWIRPQHCPINKL